MPWPVSMGGWERTRERNGQTVTVWRYEVWSMGDWRRLYDPETGEVINQYNVAVASQRNSIGNEDGRRR